MKRILYITAALFALTACQSTTSLGGNEATPEPYRTAKAERERIVDVQIKRPDWHAPQNFPVSHGWPAPDLNGLPAAKMFNALKMEERKRIQRDLLMMGLMVGTADGKWGPHTWEGVRMYAARTGMSSYLLTPRESLDVLRSISG